MTFEKLIRQWIEFNENRGKWSKTSKSKTEIWDGFFRNHIPESLRVCPVTQLTAQMFYDALAEKWRTMVDTPERILSDARLGYALGNDSSDDQSLHRQRRQARGLVAARPSCRRA